MSDLQTWEEFDRPWLDERRRQRYETDDRDRTAADDHGVQREALSAPGRPVLDRKSVV